MKLPTLILSYRAAQISHAVWQPGRTTGNPSRKTINDQTRLKLLRPERPYHTVMTQHTTKKDLSQALSKLHKSVRHMIAQEVNCVVYKDNKASHAASGTALADFLIKCPLQARKAARFLKRSSKDTAYQELGDLILGVKGADTVVIDKVTLHPESDTRLQVTQGTAQSWIEYSTDPKVGLIFINPKYPDEGLQLRLLPGYSLPLIELAGKMIQPPTPQSSSAVKRKAQ